MRREFDERFVAYVRERGDRQLRVAVLLAGDWHAAEDLVQVSLLKLYRVWPQLDAGADLDAYLRRIMAIPGVRETVSIEHIKQGYYSIKALNPTGIVPLGPERLLPG